MRGWLLVPLLAASGCLYLDGVNDVPLISFDVQQRDVHTNVGKTLQLTTNVQDNDKNSVDVTYTVASGDDTPLDPCDFDRTDRSITFFRKGTFIVTAHARDDHGAASDGNDPNAQAIFEVVNDAPVFPPTVVPQPTVNANQCEKFALSNPIPIGLTFDTKNNKPQDPDPFSLPARCGGKPSPMTYKWRVSPPAGANAVLTASDNGGCAPKTAASSAELVVSDYTSQVCLWPDTTVMNGISMYAVVLEASDGVNTTPSMATQLAIGPNEPPCITATEPAIGSYVIDRTQPYLLQVAGVEDDQDVFSDTHSTITFAWSISTDSDTSWYTLANYSLSSYTLDPSSFGVGQVVHVRVEAIDSSGELAGGTMCPLSAPDCVVQSCKTSHCYKWRTWDLELR